MDSQSANLSEGAKLHGELPLFQHSTQSENNVCLIITGTCQKMSKSVNEQRDFLGGKGRKVQTEYR